MSGRMITGEGNAAIVSSFTQLRHSLKDHFHKEAQEPGSNRNGGTIGKKSSNNFGKAADIRGKSIELGRNSIYAQKKESKASKSKSSINDSHPARRNELNDRALEAKQDYTNMDDHKIEMSELLQRLKTNEELGISQDEAVHRNATLGDNVLPKGKRTPRWLLYLKELLSPFALLLWVGAVLVLIAYLLQRYQGPSNLYLCIVLVIVIVLTATLSYYQNAKSDSLMEGFKKLIPHDCVVVRDGKKQKIEGRTLVPGDLVELKAGDNVPADLRIVQSREMKVDNSPLTGEAKLKLLKRECTNDNPLETSNLAFSGTLCKEGSGSGIVIRIGGSTVLGQIAKFTMEGERVMTPMRRQLNLLVIIFAGLALVMGLIVLFAARYAVKYTWLNALQFGIGSLVANIPEGLLGCITVTLAITAKNLYKKFVLVKNLEAVETLGSCSCICSDKTGTLTQNKMTVEHVWLSDHFIRAVNKQKAQSQDPPTTLEYNENDEDFKVLQDVAVVSSEATFQLHGEGENNNSQPLKQENLNTQPRIEKNGVVQQDKVVWLEAKVNGDASETALMKFFQPIQDILETRKHFQFAKSVDGQPAKMLFNSTFKFALSIVEQRTQNSLYTVFVKGAPEKLWTLCTFIQNGNKAEQVDDAWNKKFQTANESMANGGERVLGFAKLHLPEDQFPQNFKFITTVPDEFNFKFEKLTFVGLISLIDPPKDSVPWAVKKCRTAGIKVVMVTGDQPATAAAIAKQVNIIPSDLKTNIDFMREVPGISKEEAISMAKAIVIEGKDIQASLQAQRDKGCDENHDDADLQLWLQKEFIVFARTSPIHKFKIVRAAQRIGHIAAVTGDGVNDSPAIKQGDIGVSMGISGSDVTKDAADMILLNDDFGSIVDGVEEGRKIYDNLKKSIVYVLNNNISEVIPFLAQIIFRIPLALSNILQLMISVGTDIVPTISFAYEVGEYDIMVRRPRSQNDNLLSINLLFHGYLQMGIIISAGAFFAFFASMRWYGFSAEAMFKQHTGNLHAALRCQLDSSCNCKSTQTPFSSYNRDAYDLGNPYLSVANIGEMTSDNIANYYIHSCCGGNPSKFSKVSDSNCPKYSQLDWNFYGDYQQDLRQVYVYFDRTDTSLNQYGRWRTMDEIFLDCQTFPNSQYMSFDEIKANGHQYDNSIQTYTYVNGRFKTPVCYTTEALKYGQTAYFIGVVMCQISDVFSCKCKKMSSIYSQFNRILIYGIIVEVSLTAFLCYVPKVQYALLSRPVRFVAWFGAMPFSLALFAWMEVRKYLLRRKFPQGAENWFLKTFEW